MGFLPPESSGRRRMLGVLAAILFEAIYGASFVFTKSASSGYSSLTILAWRFLIAFAVMELLRLTGLIRIRLSFRELPPLLPMVLCYPIGYLLLELAGVRLTSASESGILISLCPVVCILASAVILHKRPSRTQVAGILIALCGSVCAVAAKGMTASFSLQGYLALLAALTVYSLYAVILERNADTVSGISLTYLMLFAGFLFFCAGALAEHAAAGTLRALVSAPFTDRAFLAAVLYLSIASSIGAYFLNNYAIQAIGTNGTAAFAGVDAAVAILLGMALQNDIILPGQVIGVVLLLLGVWIASRPSRAGRRA